MRLWLSRLCVPALAAGLVGVPAGAGRAATVCAQAPSDPAVQERLKRIGAELFGGGGSIETAVQELKAILAADPRSVSAHFLLGIAYRRLGTPELQGEAAAELRQALALDPAFIPARYYLAELYLELGRASRTKEEAEAALAQAPGAPQFLALLGEAERRLGHPARAAERAREALEAEPAFAQARYYLALALFDLGRRDEAVRELEAVAASGAAVVDVYLALGGAYLQTGRTAEARQALDRARQLDPVRPDVHIQLARVHRLDGRLKEADEALTRAMAVGGTASASLYRDQQAEFDLELERGLLRLRQGRLDDGIASLRKALDMEPDHGEANRHMAEALLQQGQYARAAEHAARAEKAGVPLSDAARKRLDARPPRATPRK